jgi:hypothetical protein
MATAVKQPQLDSLVFDNDLNRQALMNSNFDIWQRAVTFTNPVANQYVADRWKLVYDTGGGTLPTSIIHSRQITAAADIPNAHWYYRISPNGAGSGFGTNSGYYLSQNIENGVRKLCGYGNKLSISVWARSSIVGKRLGVSAFQYYGTGGSPSGVSVLKGDVFNLTSSWAKYTVTLTTDTLSGKTFGTTQDDFLSFALWEQWSSGYADTYIKTGAGAETFVGSGDIDIAQVQMNLGDFVLPYHPKTYQQEYLDCLRYCFCQITPAAGYAVSTLGYANSTTHAYPFIEYAVPMRRQPNIETAYTTATDWQLADGVNAAADVTAMSINQSTKYRLMMDCTATGLTQYRTYVIVSDSGGARTLSLEAEVA